MFAQKKRQQQQGKIRQRERERERRSTQEEKKEHKIKRRGGRRREHRIESYTRTHARSFTKKIKRYRTREKKEDESFVNFTNDKKI